MDKLWILPAAVEARRLADFAAELGVSPLLARLLWSGGRECADLARPFLQPRLKSLGDPFLLPGMAAAVDRVERALARGEKIALYGDYDVDGVASLALLHRVLTTLGGKVGCFLPHRMDEGYGLSEDGVARCLKEHAPTLLLAVDCGTSSATLISQIEAGGVDVIVLDHHEAGIGAPSCTALVNPKAAPVGEGADDLKYLCSGGLAFKLCHALLKQRGNREIDLRDYLDLVALATVSDLADLEGENRILVQVGLTRLAQSKWPGVKALAEVAGVAPPFRSQDLAFKLGPRLNAAGRLDSAQAALDLLLTDDPRRAQQLAKVLDKQNRERQGVESEVLEEALAMVEESAWGPGPAIVVGKEGWHQGVLGIVAARLMRKYHRPAFVIGFDETGMGKGSGRSIEGFALVEALAACAPHLAKFGGHDRAAGLSIQRDQLDAFRELFTALARERIAEEHLRPRLRIGAEVQLHELHMDFLGEHEALQPFGQCNPRPLLCVKGVRLHQQPGIMAQKHSKLELAQGRERRTAMYFNVLPNQLPPQPWDVAFCIEPNKWNGTVKLQLTIEDIRPAQ